MIYWFYLKEGRNFMQEILKKILDKITGIEEGQRKLEEGQKKLEIKIEQNIEPKIQALFEDRDIIHDKLDSIQSDIQGIKDRLDKQEFEIRLVKRKAAK